MGKSILAVSYKPNGTIVVSKGKDSAIFSEGGNSVVVAKVTKGTIGGLMFNDDSRVPSDIELYVYWQTLIKDIV